MLQAILGFIGVYLAFSLLRSAYFFLRPKAKKAYLEKEARKAEENAKEAEEQKKKYYEALVIEGTARIERENEKKREQERQRVIEEGIIAAQQKREIEDQERRDAIEKERQEHRDADKQSTPYTYEIGSHGNESLAIRYGIANQERKVKEFSYYAKGGKRKRNPDRDEVYYEPARTIRLQKTRKVGDSMYEVLLTDYRDRPAKAVIEAGTEHVKTFYPLDDGWFEKYADLEQTLKGNGTFTLKELATFHVQKTVGT